MHEFVLMGLAAILLLLAIAILAYPLRRHKKGLLLIIPLYLVLSLTAYWYWGGFAQWQAFNKAQAQKKQVQAILKQIKSPQVLVAQLKSRLKQDPTSAKGWYLLGRLDASLGDWQAAAKAFLRAKQLNPSDVLVQVNYAAALWQTRHQHFDEEICALLQAVLVQDAQQVDALSMLAMAAFQEKDYPKAIDYWQRLLQMAQANSADANAIAEAIAKAHELNDARR